MHPTEQRIPFSERLNQYFPLVEETKTLCVEGRLTRMVGMAMEASGCYAPMGSRCLIRTPDGKEQLAEVVGFAQDKVFLMSTHYVQEISPGARVIPTGRGASVRCSDDMLGRILDGEGQPIDDGSPLPKGDDVAIHGRAINPLKRLPIRNSLDVGVRAINALLRVGRGQRMGLFAGSGVGKSVLLGMMTKFTTADVVVVGLIGERGREVQEFIQDILGEEGLRRSVVIAVPADRSPLMRLNGAMVATSVAEYFRDQGKNVLLLMDSLTRFCQAQRELALAIGEPPATKGYPPSVFARLPHLVERAGCSDRGEGSITAFYTVLVEGDDQQEPIADAARAILDGHIVLSRQLAEMGQYPAIDIEASISRLLPQLTDASTQDLIRQFKRIYSTYQQNRDLINIGAYQHGSNPAIDEAMVMIGAMNEFLSQGMTERQNLADSLEQLSVLLTS